MTDQLGPLVLVSPLVKANSSHLAELVELQVVYDFGIG